MSMFPGAGAQVYRNEAGEVLGWDYPGADDPYDPDDYLPGPDDERFCDECGEPFTINSNGIANHDSDTTPDGIDHDADEDHVPYCLEDA